MVQSVAVFCTDISRSSGQADPKHGRHVHRDSLAVFLDFPGQPITLADSLGSAIEHEGLIRHQGIWLKKVYDALGYNGGLGNSSLQSSVSSPLIFSVDFAGVGTYRNGVIDHRDDETNESS